MSKKTITITEGREKLFKIAQEVQKPDTYYELTIDGKPLVVLLSREEFDSILETIEILQNPEILNDLKRAEDDFKKGRYSSWEEAKKTLHLEESFVLYDKAKAKYSSKAKKYERSKKRKV